jgi:hypothetical protein
VLPTSADIPVPTCDLVVLQAIVAGIEAVDVVPGRTEIIDEGQSFPVIVDSASTPEALSRHGNQPASQLVDGNTPLCRSLCTSSAAGVSAASVSRARQVAAGLLL